MEWVAEREGAGSFVGRERCILSRKGREKE
jgi:hypothetical protein